MTKHILTISGSLRQASFNSLLLDVITTHAPKNWSVVRGSIAGFPVYNGDEDGEVKPEAMVRLAAQIAKADAVIIATPEYNYSVPGGLKNALDWLSRIPAQPFKDKRVGIVGAAMGPLGTARAQYHLRQVFQFLESHVMPKPEVFLGLAHLKFADGKLNDEPTAQVIKGWVDAFDAWVARG